MKTYFKTVYRMFRRHIVRFLNIIAIIIVSIGFMSGIGEAQTKIELAFDGEYKSQNISDLIIKSSSPYGFSEDERALIEEKMSLWGLKDIKYALSFDEESGDEIVRYYFMDMGDMPLNIFNLTNGRLPEKPDEVLAERRTDKITGYEIGENIVYNGMTFTVSGIIENPLIKINKEEPSYLDRDRSINNVIYFSTTPPVVGDIYLTLEDRKLFDSFSSKYEAKISELKEQINELLPEVTILGLAENYAISTLLSYAEKVGLIGIIFVVFFLLVTALVVFSNMTRLIDEERAQIACMKTLGFSSFKILLKYLLFIFFACVLGGAVGLPVGYGLTFVIYTSFTTRYLLPKFPGGGSHLYFAISCLIILVSSLLVTLFVGAKSARTKPALLLIPKAPSAGRKTLLERIPLIWNRFSFKYKSSIRNVFLFKSRFFMSVISVIGSTVLVLAGFGLLDCVLKNAMAAVISIISVALIVFAGALCILVVYNIASMSISERHREIATLKVLGYHNIEVVGYIFREIFITNLIGALLGIPLGVVFLNFVFNLVNVGELSDVNWWTWIVGPAVTMIFTAITMLLLCRKIIRIDMNSSLKALE